jgi:hypothetical protein
MLETNLLKAKKKVFNDSLLFNFGGTVGDTIMTDDLGSTVITTGKIALDAATNKTVGSFANESILLATPLLLDADFTIEVVLMLKAYPSNSTLLSIISNEDIPGQPTFSPVGILAGSATSQYLAIWINEVISLALVNVSIQLNTYYHIAATRQGLVYRTFINGTKGHQVTGAKHMVGKITHLLHHASPGARLNGNVKALRLTKGKALYTDSYTPPALPLAKI